MCNPIVIAAASAALQVYSSYGAAKDQNKLYEQNARNANIAAGHDYAALSLQGEQDRQAASQDLVRNTIDAERARGRANASATSQGVAGLSIDALLNSITMEEGQNASTVIANKSWRDDQRAMEARGVQQGARANINSVPRGNFNPLLGALQIGAAAGGAYADKRATDTAAERALKRSTSTSTR